MKSVHAETPEEWRSWLAKHHATEEKVLLIKHKRHTGKATFHNSDAMDEAICYGWIDTTLKRVDDDRYGVTYVKRGKNSRWSHNTVARAKRLIAEGRMTPAGKVALEEGMQRPLLERFPKRIPLPLELKEALSKNKGARAFFNSLAPSYRRVYTLSVVKAKRAETREKWARFVVERCADEKKPFDP